MARYFTWALAVAVLSYYARQQYKVGLPDWYWKARLPDHIVDIDVTDTAKLKRVLFSGEPWLLQCYSGIPHVGQHLPRPYRVDPILMQSLANMRGLIKAGVVDCEAMLPSNKSLVEKFGLVRRTQPLMLLASGFKKPQQLPSNAVSSAYTVTAWVKPKAEPKVWKVSTQKSLQGACSGPKTCLLTRLPPDSTVLEQLAREFRTLEVVTLGEEGGRVSLAWGRGQEVRRLPAAARVQTGPGAE